MNRRRDELSKWEKAAIVDHLRWHKDAKVIRLNSTLTALKENEKWHVVEIKVKEIKQ